MLIGTADASADSVGKEWIAGRIVRFREGRAVEPIAVPDKVCSLVRRDCAAYDETVGSACYLPRLDLVQRECGGS